MVNVKVRYGGEHAGEYGSECDDNSDGDVAMWVWSY